MHGDIELKAGCNDEPESMGDIQPHHPGGVGIYEDHSPNERANIYDNVYEGQGLIP